MAGEIRVPYPSGNTLTFVVRDPANPTKVWYPDAGPAAWETFGTGARTNADYDIAIADKSGDWYVGDFPSGIAAGYYDVILLINGVVNTGWGIDWNGSARIESASDHAAVIQAEIEENGASLLATINTNAARLTAVRAAVLTDWINGGRLDLLLDAMKVVTDLLADSATTLLTGTVSYDNTNATTTVFYCDDITEATADHYQGREVIFLTAALFRQATDITAYALVSGEGKFTVTALTEAPPDNCTFVIV